MAVEARMFDPGRMISAVKEFRGKRVLVLGDLILDRFVWGAVSRICPEAPVPVVEIKTESTRPGGAANVAANVYSLGGRPHAVGAIGDDAEGRQLREILRELRSPLNGLVEDKSRPTSVKTRIIAHHQQVCRTDREDRSVIARALQSKVAAEFGRSVGSVDAVVISDYAKGFVSPPLLRKILPEAKRARKIVCVDPKMIDFAVYGPSTVVTPNVSEIEQAAGFPVSETRMLARAVNAILRGRGIEHVLVTRGESGMALFGNGTRPAYIQTVAREVFDVTGAGDTVISTLALALASGLSMYEAAVLSNVSAGIVVGKLGTATVTADELIEGVRQMDGRS